MEFLYIFAARIVAVILPAWLFIVEFKFGD